MQVTNLSNAINVQPPAATAAEKSAEHSSRAAAGAKKEAATRQAAETREALELARAALRAAAPDYDIGRVAQIKAQLKNSIIRFDANRLAGIIMAVHGGNG